MFSRETSTSNRKNLVVSVRSSDHSTAASHATGNRSTSLPARDCSVRSLRSILGAINVSVSGTVKRVNCTQEATWLKRCRWRCDLVVSRRLSSFISWTFSADKLASPPLQRERAHCSTSHYTLLLLQLLLKWLLLCAGWNRIRSLSLHVARVPGDVQLRRRQITLYRPTEWFKLLKSVYINGIYRTITIYNRGIIFWTTRYKPVCAKGYGEASC